MAAPRKLAILKAEDDWVRVYCPYDQGWLTAFKERVPPHDREPVFRQVGEKKYFEAWKVRVQYIDDIVALCQDIWPGQEIISDLAESTDWVGAVFDACPEGHRARLWKALAQCFHPDTTGLDPSIMVRINQEAQKRGVK